MFYLSKINRRHVSAFPPRTNPSKNKTILEHQLKYCVVYNECLSSFQGHYFLYLSVRWSHLGWYVGIKRSGKVKKGEKTWYPGGQKAIQFSHVRPYPAPPTNVDLLPVIPSSSSSPRVALGENFPPIAFIDDVEDEDAAAAVA